MKNDDAVSDLQGNLLMVGLVVILLLLILAFLLGFLNFDYFDGSLAPAIIKIIGVNHAGSKLDSQVVIRSFATEELDNHDLQAVIYVNDEKILACISTLNGHDFIPTHHYGVKTMGGSGCQGKFFSPGESIVIDLKNGRIRPGNVVELRIYQRSEGRSMAPFRGSLLDADYVEEYLSEYVFSSLQGYRLYSQHLHRA